MKRITIASDGDLAKACEAVALEAEENEAGAAVEAAVRTIVDAVRTRGDAAVAEYTAQFDGADLAPEEFEVTPDDISNALATIEPELLRALERAHANIHRFHAKNLRQSWRETQPSGAVLGQRITPIGRVGLYVPGGKAFYPSSVLMNIVPAVVAGVREIVMVSPPSWQGGIHPLVLAAAHIAGATRVFRVGGAQAVAALAFGTAAIPRVDKIAGPGNVYVTVAKRLVSNVCDIDKEAGPSEVVVISDGSGDPRYAAAELLAQAEHDEEARALLVATSAEIADAIVAAMDRELETLSRADIIRAALAAHGRIYVARGIEDAIALTNALAPEHLSIQTADPESVFDRIDHVGCAALGAGTSVAVGDYFAGPNHILPTGRRARYASPLTAEDFRKVTSILQYTPDALRAEAEDIMRLANAEELTAHARAVEIRQ